jgi:hypothetical protein
VPPTPGTVVKIATDKEFPYTLAQIVVKHPQTAVKTTDNYMQSCSQLFVQLYAEPKVGRITTESRAAVFIRPYILWPADWANRTRFRQ